MAGSGMLSVYRIGEFVAEPPNAEKTALSLRAKPNLDPRRRGSSSVVVAGDAVPVRSPPSENGLNEPAYDSELPDVLGIRESSSKTLDNGEFANPLDDGGLRGGNPAAGGVPLKC